MFTDLSTWSDGYCSAVRVTDLDSGCGFTGAVLIEHIVINGTDNATRIKQALRFSGHLPNRFMKCEPAEIKQYLRHEIEDALLSYGYYDPDEFWDRLDTSWSEVIQLEQD